MFDRDRKTIEMVLFLGGRGQKFMGIYVNHYPSINGYNIDFKRSPFGKVETMTNVPLEQIHENELEIIDGKVTLMVRNYFGSSFDEQVRSYGDIEVSKLKAERDKLASLLDFTTDELKRIPSDIRSREFTDDRLEQIRVLVGKFQQKPTTDVSVEVGEKVKDRDQKK